MATVRCGWAESDALLVEYHDREWGVPVHDDQRLFEFLILEGAQAGLSWTTILKKRQNYWRAFEDFEPEAVAGFDAARVEQLLQDEGIVRNRRKIEAAIQNALAFQAVQAEFGSFDEYIWKFVDGTPIQNGFRTLSEIPSETAQSREMSKALKRRGFGFVGPTICYAFMQAVGMVNDHLVDCFRYAEVAQTR